MKLGILTSIYLFFFQSFLAKGVSFSISGIENGRSYIEFGTIDGGSSKQLGQWVEEIKSKTGDTGVLISLNPRWR